jgi:hypothetical protein
MSRRGWVWVGIAGIALGLLGLTAVFVGRSGSPRTWVASHYTAVSSEGNSAVYRSDRKPSEVADEIKRRWKPVDSVVDPSGLYLRYSKDTIGVVPGEGGGSRIYVDDRNRGYARWFPYVGGYWGSYSGGGFGGGFRGGGPGAGK